MQIRLIVHEEYSLYATLIAGLFILGIFWGAPTIPTIHNIGLLGKNGSKSALAIVLKNTRFLGTLYMIPFAVGAVFLAVLVVLGEPIFPVWFVFFTPAVTVFVMFLWQRLPQPFRVVLYGG